MENEMNFFFPVYITIKYEKIYIKVLAACTKTMGNRSHYKTPQLKIYCLVYNNDPFLYLFELHGLSIHPDYAHSSYLKKIAVTEKNAINSEQNTEKMMIP